jgi:glycosyltransferase 2 family protein
VAMLILASAGLLLYRHGWQALLLIALAAVVAVAVVQSRPLSLRILTALEGVPVLAPRAHHLRAFYESAYVLLSWRPLLVALAIGLVSWSGECVAFFLILAGLGFAPTPGLLIRAAFVLATSTLVGSASLLPGGLGAAEASSAALLRLVLPISGPQAVVATLLIRFCTLWFGVGVGLLSLLLFRRRLGLQRVDGSAAAAPREPSVAPHP